MSGLTPDVEYEVIITARANGGFGTASVPQRDTPTVETPTPTPINTLPPLDPITLGDARLLSVPSQIRVGEVRGVQVVADRAADDEDPIVVTVSTSNRLLVIGDGCSGTAPQSSTVEDGAVLFLVGCRAGITNLTLAQDGGDATIYQIRVIDPPPTATFAPTDTRVPTTVGMPANLEADVRSFFSVNLEWAVPDQSTCNCLLPDRWKVEYESADSVRSATGPQSVR